MMKSEMPTAGAGRVEFHECFVRGKGDLVALNGCRLLNVEMKKSLVTLDGSLLDIEAGSKSMPMSQGVRWDMERSSIFTTDSVFALRSKFGSVLTETHADVRGCLLASLATEPLAPVITLDRELDFDALVKWKGQQNFYANFDKLRDWKDRETNMEYGRLTLPKLTQANQKALWEATPAWFKPTDPDEERVIRDFGQPADSEKRMMQPLTEPEEP